MADGWKTLILYARIQATRTGIRPARFRDRRRARRHTSRERHPLLCFDFQISEVLPQFIALHIRHGDFGSYCAAAGKTNVDCFPPVSTYVKHIDAIKKKWLDKTNITVTNVIVMSGKYIFGYPSVPF